MSPNLRPLAVVGRVAFLLEDIMVISSYLSTSFHTIVSYLPCSSWLTFQTFFSIVNSAIFDVSIAHNSPGAKSADYHGSCCFLLIHLCRNVSFCFYLCFDRQLRRFGAKEIFKKIIFNVTVKLWKCSENIAATLYCLPILLPERKSGRLLLTSLLLTAVTRWVMIKY